MPKGRQPPKAADVTPDWSKAKPGVVKQVVREGEMYLDGQLRLALSADQRAAILAGVFTAAATGVLAVMIALAITKDTAILHRYPVYLGGGTTAGMFLLAASLCIAAVMPVGFWLPGNQPEMWYADVDQSKDLDVALAEETKHIQDKIAENRGVLGKNAQRFKWGAIIGITAPFAGAALWLLTSSVWWLGD
jgi:hypothetical protein